MNERWFQVRCEWCSVVGGGMVGQPDGFHVYTTTEDEAIYEARRASRERPLYDLRSWSPINYSIVKVYDD